jgi:hypothetical protein
MSQSDEFLRAQFDANIDDLPESVDRAAIERMRVVATILDDSIRVPGTSYRVGLDPILGIAPAAGDLISGALSMYIVLESARLGVSYLTLVRMLGNISLDIVGGSIPLVGDLFDAAWKANKRNFELVLEDLMTREPPTRRSEGTGIEIKVE